MTGVAGILITDGGPHSPEMWAEMTVSQIVVIAEGAKDKRAEEAREFKKQLLSLLTAMHRSVQETERNIINSHGLRAIEREAPYSGDPVTAVVHDIVHMSAGTSFGSHFEKQEIKKYLSELLHNHFATAVLIERSWAADNNPTHQSSRNFRAMFYPE